MEIYITVGRWHDEDGDGTVGYTVYKNDEDIQTFSGRNGREKAWSYAEGLAHRLKEKHNAHNCVYTVIPSLNAAPYAKLPDTYGGSIQLGNSCWLIEYK